MKKILSRAVPGVFLAAIVGLSGCTAKISNLSLVSVRSIDLSQSYTQVASDVSAKTSETWVLLYFGGDDRSYYKAIGDLLAEHDGDLMTDLQVTSTSYWFVIGAYTEYRVEGNVWKLVEAGDAMSGPEDLFTLKELDGKLVLVSGDGRTVLEVVPPPRS